MNDIDFLLDTFEWSFSRLQAYYNCPYAWRERYLECQPDESSFYGEYGTFMHKILEMYEKGELSLFDLNQYYEDNFNDAVPHEAPPNQYSDIRQSYYDKGIDYLDAIDLPIDDYEILGVEKKVHFTIDDKNFVGIIDLLLKDKETGEITILDHKSGSIKLLKSGKVSKSDQAHFQNWVRQVCLYAIPVIEEYGRVDYLMWNLFKDQKWIKIPWTQELQNEAVDWAKDTLDFIKNEKEWLPNPDFYYCHYLCGQRNNACEYKP